MFGHSLGGNLVEHVYLENSNYIDKAFVINPSPISQELLNNSEKIKAFNDNDKFNCYVVEGDWVSNLKETSLYEKNIKYIKNNNLLNDNIASDHAIESISYNGDGSFEIISKDNITDEHDHTISRKTINFASQGIKKINNIIDEISDKFN